jgi:hypothetical protein
MITVQTIGRFSSSGPKVGRNAACGLIAIPQDSYFIFKN